MAYACPSLNIQHPCIGLKFEIIYYLKTRPLLLQKLEPFFAFTKLLDLLPYKVKEANFYLTREAALTDGKVLYYGLNKIEADQQISWILKLKAC